MSLVVWLSRAISEIDWSHVFDVVLGAVIAVVVARLAEHRARKAMEKAEAEMVGVKLAKMINWLEGMRLGIGALWDDPQRQALAPWERLLPQAGSGPATVSFTEAQIAVILGLKDETLIQRMLQLDEHYIMTLSVLSHYGRRRVELTDRLPISYVNGEPQLDRSSAAYLQCYGQRHELNMMAEQLRGAVLEMFEITSQIIALYGPAAKARYGVSTWPEVAGQTAKMGLSSPPATAGAVSA